MATETLISPGVLTTENDQSFITTGPVSVGLALVGPTVKGTPNIPTVVTSYSDFKNKFGGSFVSGGATYEYLTSIAAYNYFQQGGSTILVNRVVSGSFTQATTNETIWVSGSTTANHTASFTLKTINYGEIMNNSGSNYTGSNGTLTSGSNENIRWEIQNVNTSQGTFTLVIRQGNDSVSTPNVLETFTGCSLDPNSPNYIEAVVGNQYKTISYDASSGWYIKTNGDYTNKSKYVYVSSVNRPTPNYFDNNGTAKAIYTNVNGAASGSYLPAIGSGSYYGTFGSALGNDTLLPLNMFTNINSTNTQGLANGAYATASSILANTDEYDFSLLATPGIYHDDYTSVSSFVTMAQNRGDCFYIADLAAYNATLGTVTAAALELDSSYAGSYWPWVQVSSQETGKLVWVPASTVMPGVYAFSDRVSAEWFAPAGLTRGGLSVIQAERKLSPTDRDTLYASKVNPIASFPGVGTVAYGQKTLQQKASALDRINVRRLLINLKRFVGNVGESLVFEQNTTVTRNNFLASVNPYLESVQQKQGLYAFKVVMDESNNGPDVIDRNQLVGQIYIQPTKTVEFVLLSFNITPTGASFQ